jgi:hypothetical protein
MLKSNDPENFIGPLVDLSMALYQGSDADRAVVAQFLRSNHPPLFRGALATLLSLTGKPPESALLSQMIQEGQTGLTPLVVLSVGVVPFEKPHEGLLSSFWRAYFLALTARGYAETAYREKYAIDSARPQTLPTSEFWSRVTQVRDPSLAKVLLEAFRTTEQSALRRDILSSLLDGREVSTARSLAEIVPTERDPKVKGQIYTLLANRLNEPGAKEEYERWYYNEQDAGLKALLLMHLSDRLPAAEAATFLSTQFTQSGDESLHARIIDQLWLSSNPSAADALVQIARSAQAPSTRACAISRVAESDFIPKDRKETALREGLLQADAKVRMTSLKGLVKVLGDQAEVDLLKASKSDSSDDLRKYAAERLESIRQSRQE